MLNQKQLVQLAPIWYTSVSRFAREQELLQFSVTHGYLKIAALYSTCCNKYCVMIIKVSVMLDGFITTCFNIVFFFSN